MFKNGGVCVFLDPLFHYSLWNCKWIFIWVTHETIVHMVCTGVHCLYLSGMSVAYVCIQIHVVCVYIVVGIECEYSG